MKIRALHAYVCAGAECATEWQSISWNNGRSTEGIVKYLNKLKNKATSIYIGGFIYNFFIVSKAARTKTR